uniref:Fibronectin type-II domain-containing protein n=1 Tax=Ornithorhynchus anatinus TaxID=9258 RepID=A0A6I8NY46_ORNAN
INHFTNSGGKSCVIPFQYQGKTYHSCTNQNSPASYWCSTTEDYGRDGLWSYCADTAPCVFPFTYRNGTHHSCTTAGEEGGRPWCSTTDNYPRDRKWTYCQLSGAGSNSRPCSFPFTYKDKIHTSCTSEDTPGQSWCATAPKFQGDATWKYWSDTNPSSRVPGRPCVFPFAYLERMRYGCVLEDNKPREAWCATTENYDRDQLWSFCPDTSNGEARGEAGGGPAGGVVRDGRERAALGP